MQEVQLSLGLDKFLPAFLEVKKTISNPKKNTKGHNYRYADLTEVYNTITPPCLEHGIIPTQQIVTKDGVMGVRTTLFHTSGQSIENEFYVPSNLKSLNKGNQLQEVGSLTTYLKRYALVTMFCLGTDDDDGAIWKNAGKPAPKADNPKPRAGKSNIGRLKEFLRDNGLGNGMSQITKDSIDTFSQDKAYALLKKLEDKVKSKEVIGGQDAEKVIINF